MMRHLSLAVVYVLIPLFFFAGCGIHGRRSSKAQTGTIIGAVVGGVAGAVLGRKVISSHPSIGAVLGSTVGSAAGSAGGKMAGALLDRQKRDLEDAIEDLDEVESVRKLSNGELSITLRDEILFDEGETFLKSKAKKGLKKLAKVLNRYPKHKICIEMKGGKLSRKRSEAVKDFLIAYGVDPERISIRGEEKQKLELKVIQ